MQNKSRVSVIGAGWVGKSMVQLFSDALVYDKFNTCSFPEDLPEEDCKKAINECDIAFICVPTPCLDEGKLDTSIVEEVVEWCECPLLVIRSTINPGDSNLFVNKYGKRIVVQPEYLGETPSHPLLDPKMRPFLIIGGEQEDRQKLIDLYATVYNANISIRQVTNYQAEIIKLSENRAIAFKVAQCQELYDVCQKANEDYYTIINAVYGDDPRMNLWWTMIYPDQRGMNSKCIPKDVYAWQAWAESVGYDAKITRTILEKNKEWIA